MLKQLGFVANMIKWIMWYATIIIFSMLMNNSPSKPFKIQREIRQGGPISSFLFNIISESLNFIIDEAYSKGLISGLKVGDENIEATHLNYDTILFLEKDDLTFINYRRLLECFSVMTSLEVHFSKSTLVSSSKNNP